MWGVVLVTEELWETGTKVWRRVEKRKWDRGKKGLTRVDMWGTRGAEWGSGMAL